ncbi:hypothetical protein ZHAS_00010006 [Anopheles sinensis]|uniref:Uncharacterized protein n=1 Tax=Anopheles sinensis TaxID=74873 RepID=A0A084VWH6_ANOSI|nr:hypothetical protein ZHAS_00010006 [Anopheles sinensis]
MARDTTTFPVKAAGSKEDPHDTQDVPAGCFFLFRLQTFLVPRTSSKIPIGA